MASLILYGLVAAIANALGGYLLTSDRYKPGLRALPYLLAVGAGFMLAAVFLEVLPRAVQSWPGNISFPLALALSGYLLIQFVEHTIVPHFHFGEETHVEALLDSRAMYSAIVGVAIHTFFDGVTIASGFVADVKLGLLLFIAVMLHKLPEGFTVSSIVLAAGRSKNQARLASLLVGASTLAGVMAVGGFRNTVAYALPFSAGVTLYVAASDLLPEVNRMSGKFTSIAVFGGVALYYLAEAAVGAFGW
ncbi:MAG: ZIP family metal transporter [Acidobacteria bacterium]|nr:ZIP family metal transporter [Acidobacteriota bacterium]